MPTDWSVIETDLVRKIKTRFHGNPRYLEWIDKSNKKSHETTERPIAPSIVFNDDYLEGGEEEVKNLESLTYNDIVSVTEFDEVMDETVKRRVVLSVILLE